MALKYWYVAGNGSSNFNTAGVWYNGPGGTGGTTTTPTAADDAIVNAASGSGTLTITATATINSLNTKTFTGTLAGTNALNITTTTLPSDNYVLQLGGNHTYSGTITFNTTLDLGSYTLYINCNGIFHKGNMTFNSTTVNAEWYSYDDINSNLVPLRMTGAFGLTKGYVDCNELYAASISTSNSNFRGIYVDDIYLSGSGTLLVATTQTGLSWNLTNSIHLTNTTATAKAISFSGVAYAPNLYIEGSGASSTTITVAVATDDYPNVIVSKTQGTFLFGTSYIRDLTFIEGSTVTWAGTSNLTVHGNVTLCNSMSITTSNALIFQGPNLGVDNQTLTTFGKTFTGTLSINDTGYNSLNLTINGNYLTTGTITITAANIVTFNNSISSSNSISINGSSTGAFPTVDFNGGILTATTLSITDAFVYLNNSFLSGGLSLSTGSLQLLTNSVHSFFTFTSSSSTNVRSIFLGNNTTINIRGNVANSWNTSQGLAQGVLLFNAGTSTINIIDNTSSAAVSFQTGGVSFYNIHLNRSNNSINPPQITFTGGLYCVNFRDFTVMPAGVFNYIVFGGGTPIVFSDTFQVGNDINPTYILSSSTTPVTITKLNPGLVICPRLSLYNINASQTNTFYAIKGSTDNGGNNQWIFNTPPRRLSSLGAG
jgi:hypothetical protein